MAVSSPSAVDALAGQRAVGGDSHFPASENADTLPPATKIQLVNASGNNELQMTPAPGPDADPDNVDVSDIGLSDLLHWMQPADRYAYLFGCFNAVFFGFLQPAMVYYLGEVFDASATAGSDPARNQAFADRILQILWIWGVISVLNWVTAMFYMWSFEWATARQLYKIRTEYFETTLYHSCAWFDAKDPLTVPSRLMVDMRKIKEALGSKMAMAVMNTAQFFAGILFGFIVNAELTAVCCILLPLMVYSTYLFASALTGYSKWMAKFYVGSGALAEEVFSAVKTVIANGAEEREYDRYRKLLLPARAGKARVATRYGFQLGCMDASCFLIYGLCFWYASKLIAGGEGSSGENGLNFDGQGGGRLDGADVLKVVFNIVIGAFGLGQVAPAIQAYAEAKPALKNMKIMREEWLEMKAQQGSCRSGAGAGSGSGSTNKVADGPLAGGGLNAVASLPSGGVSQQKNSDGSGNGYAVEATDVCFTYPARPDVQVLKSVSFKIAEGSKVAFVGESGSGKSTIIQLIERFYDVDGTNRKNGLGAPAAAAGALGQMWVSGRPVTEYASLDELRRQIGYVQQEPVLFECTIRENLLYGCESFEKPSEADVIAACKQAQIWELIESLPDKLDTRPGSGGSQLSGGQKQRIAIARALVRKPKILLLDEATSSLDTVSEREVQQTIDGLSAVVGGGGGGASVSTTAAPSSSGGKLTVIMVAHRLSTVRNCDKIFFLNRGEILEEGSHDELVEMKGGYYKLTETQAMYDSLAEFARTNSKEGGARVLTEGQESPIVVDLPSAVDGAVDGGLPPPGAGGSTQELAPVERQNSKDSKGSKGSKENKMKDGKAPDGAVPAVLKSAEEREEERVNEIAKTYSVPFRRLFSLSTGSELMFYPVGFGFSLVNGAMQPTMMWLMMDAIEHLYNPDHAKMKEGVNEFAWQAVGLAFCLITCFTMSHTCYGYVGSWMTYRARCLVFKTYLMQDMSFFDEPEHAPGRLTALLEKQSADLGFLAGESLGSKCEMLSSITLGLTFAFVASWKLALVVLAALPLLMASMVLMMMVALVGSMEEVTTDSPEVVASGNVIAEAVLAIKTVKALSCETDFLKKFDAMVLAISKRESKKAMWTGIAFGFSNGVMGLIFIVCFWYGAELVKEGLSPTDMFKAVMCIFFAGMAAGQAAATVPNTARALAAAHDMFALVDRVPLVDNTEEGNLRDKTDLGLGRGGGEVVTTSSTASTGDRNAELLGVAFDKVKFAYPQRAELPVLKLEDQILRMNCGGAASKSVALAGPSGSGKSTVMALLQRFYDPDAGKVLIDTDRGLKPSEDEGRDAAAPRGLDLKDANIRRWRDSCGYVGQEPVLFNLSARENILYGMGSEERAKLAGAGVAGSTKNKEDELLASISQQCNIDFIGGPNQLGWDEKLGPRGNRISGGQKQRIAIARALVRRPIVLMLDEATSSLDAVSEKEVQAALEKISGPKLTVTIAHRLSTIANCDNIIVMNDGKILEEGSHAELLEKQGLYFKLVQTSGRKSGTM